MFLALAQLTNKAFTDAGKGRIRQSLTALVKYVIDMGYFQVSISLNIHRLTDSSLQVYIYIYIYIYKYLNFQSYIFGFMYIFVPKM